MKPENLLDSTVDPKKYQEFENNDDSKVAESKSDFKINTNSQEVSDESLTESSDNSLDEKTRKIVDQNLIQKRISSLPSGLRGILVENFRADFVSIEKIDPDLLV